MQRWLSRLSYSFLIVAGFLLWEAHKLSQSSDSSSSWRPLLYVIGAACAVVVGFAGIRARYRDIT